MDDERKEWDRMEGEPNRWYQRFERFRLQGPNRSIEATYRAECEAKNSAVKRPSKLWYTRAGQWQWRARAEAWDQYLIDQAEAEVERIWRQKLMGETEILGRLSEQGRISIGEFILVRQVPYKTRDGALVTDPETGKPIMMETWDLNMEMVKKHGHLIKSITSTRYGPRIELHDGQTALIQMGKRHKLWTDVQEHHGEITSIEMSMDEWKTQQASRREQAAETLALFDEQIEDGNG